MAIEDIVSPDAETTTNEQGGSQSHIPVRFDLIDGQAMFAMAAVLHTGAEKYGPDNWRKIPVEDHLNHLIMHAYAYLAGDKTDDHLSHIMCRAMFAQAVEIQEPERNKDDTELPLGEAPEFMCERMLKDYRGTERVCGKFESDPIHKGEGGAYSHEFKYPDFVLGADMAKANPAIDVYVKSEAIDKAMVGHVVIDEK
jgi:hypothetical protein